MRKRTMGVATGKRDASAWWVIRQKEDPRIAKIFQAKEANILMI